MFNLEKKGTSVFYVNLSEVGSGTEKKYCKASINYNTSLVEEASNYCLSIEKCSIPLHSIRYMEDIVSALSFVDKITGVATAHSIIKIYSFNDFMGKINSFSDPSGDATKKLNFYLQDSGRIRINYNNYNNYNILLNDQLKDILDFPTNLITANANEANFDCISSIIDRTDQLKRLHITSPNLPVVSEFSQKTKRKVITTIDYAVPTQFSLASGNDKQISNDYTISLPSGRSDLILTPQYPRMISMNGSSINSVEIEIYAEILNRKTGQLELKRINLRPGSVFNIKIAFWKKAL